MKLTEKQLAKIFKNHNVTQCQSDSCVNDLFTSTDASDQRLAAVEQVSNDNLLSAAVHVSNNLSQWSKKIGQDIESQCQAKPGLKSMFTEHLFSWLKPSLATAAVVTSVYFMAPELTQEINKQQKSDNIFLATSFEAKQSDVIKSLSFDQKKSQSDIITKTNFG